MLEVMGQDYIRTARAKGLREMGVVIVHALRNALIPLLTILGFLLGSLVEGTFLTETIFGIPGMGQFAFEALGGRDYPVIITVTLLIAIAYALGNLCVDLLYGVVDPRIRQA
jgi:ABC-type dipeptide/oligopeptide/nickel transport system permease component